MTAADDTNSASVIRTRTSGGLSGVTFHTSPRARLSLPYNSLESVELRDSGEVLLFFKEYEITLHGAALQQLPEDFILHKILRVQVDSRTEGLAGQEASESITRIVPRRTKGEARGAEIGPPAKRGR